MLEEDFYASTVTRLTKRHLNRHSPRAVAQVLLAEWVRHAARDDSAGRFAAIHEAHRRLEQMRPTHDAEDLAEWQHSLRRTSHSISTIGA